MASKSFDLAASISPQQVEVEAAGRAFTIPIRPASDWILAIADDEPITAIFPGLLSEDGYERVMELLADEKLDAVDLRKPAFAAVSKASGFRWWEAFNLVGMCTHGPLVIGELALRGIDAGSVPFGRWCAALYALNLRGLDEKERQKWIGKFTFPPPLAEAMDEAASSDSFQDMIKGFRGMPGVSGG
jgi:hypothetical protein